MKKRLILVIFIVTLVLSASVFCCKAYADTYVPWNVCVTIRHADVSVRYDLSRAIGSEGGDRDRLFYESGRAKLRLIKKLLAWDIPFDAAIDYVLPDFTAAVKDFSFVERDRKDARVSFGSGGFVYAEGNDGVEINRMLLVERALSSNGREITVELPLIIDKAVTVSDLKAVTVKKGEFTTSFYSSGENRVHNIRRAAASLDGITVDAGETFSFNNAVGARTEQNGYKTSKIILDGNYTDGVGGGVCQVSTTLYNALLLSEFIPKATRHSLVSSYVMAGFDAMVSYGAADLTFVNDTGYPVYIGAKVRGKTVTFTVYGKPNEYKVERENVETREPFAIKEIIDPVKYPELLYTDQTKVVVNGSDGVTTQSFLCYYKNGKLARRKLFRTDKYKKVDKVVAKGPNVRPEADASNAGESSPLALP